MAYVDVSELQRVLFPGTPPNRAEIDAMQRKLDEAAQEIDWDLSISVDNPAPADSPLLADVNLDRAIELWKMDTSPFGMLPVGPDQVPLISRQDTWYRHHLRLQPLRTSFAIG